MRSRSSRMGCRQKIWPHHLHRCPQTYWVRPICPISRSGWTRSALSTGCGSQWQTGENIPQEDRNLDAATHFQTKIPDRGGTDASLRDASSPSAGLVCERDSGHAEQDRTHAPEFHHRSPGSPKTASPRTPLWRSGADRAGTDYLLTRQHLNV